MSRPTPTYLYHFTHLANVVDIANHGALRCDDDAQASGCLQRDIGEPDLKNKRRLIEVPCSPGGRLSSYVPFYFACRSPMMVKLAQAGVPGYTDGQNPLIYFVTSVELIEQAGLPWVFSDRHAAAAVVDFYNQIGDLDTEVDWRVMELRYWAGSYDHKSLRQAEFDVLGQVPLELIAKCVTRTHLSAQRLARAFAEAGWTIPIEVHHDDKWYFATYP